MVRIVGLEIDDRRKVWFGLTKLYGVGPNNVWDLLAIAKVDGNKRVKDLTDEEIGRIQKGLEEKFNVEGDLRREVQDNIKRLKTAGTYRGVRHTRGLPTRGQNTRSNGRTRRGKRKTVGSMTKDTKQQMTTDK